MTDGTPFESVPKVLRAVVLSRGFPALTSVQDAVLDPATEGRDLRISSQTGSGKTIALGFVLQRELEGKGPAGVDPCAPRALVIAPTRELAAQVQKELAWLLEPANLRVAQVTGGSSFGGELRTLRRGAEIIVATPGRLRDHIERGTIDPREVCSIVLDEADQLLDMGFREELDAILERVPENRRAHLVSATFSREVIELSTRHQHDAIGVEGTRLGVANVDIAHVVHPIVERERDDVLVNLLLLAPDDPTLVFARTREGAAELAEKLRGLGFAAAGLTGDMEQRERTRTLDGFRSGAVKVLVATDVAARGIDVIDITRVIHADPPNDPELYTHRSGRTGRAGNKGTSVLLLPKHGTVFARRLLARARVEARWEPAPSADVVARAVRARTIETLASPTDDDGDDDLGAIADALLGRAEARTVVMRLLARAKGTLASAREVTAVAPALERNVRAPEVPRGQRYGARERGPERAYVPFRVTWGSVHGADPRRLLALVCRRGGIRGGDVGIIDVGEIDSRVEVASEVAEEFAVAARRPDPRDRRVRIEQLATERPRPVRPAAPRRESPARDIEPPRAPKRPAQGTEPPRAPKRPPYAERPASHAPMARVPKRGVFGGKKPR